MGMNSGQAGDEARDYPLARRRRRRRRRARARRTRGVLLFLLPSAFVFHVSCFVFRAFSYNLSRRAGAVPADSLCQEGNEDTGH